MNKKVTILSIDGGGIRGILPGVVLAYIEKRLLELEGGQARLSDYFDLMAGTSTGGILSLIYLAPDGSGRPKFTAQQAVDLYLDHGHEIFSVSFWEKVRSAGGLTDEKYPSEHLEKALYDYFGDLKLSQLLKPSIITSYDIFNRRSVFFNKVDATGNDINDFYVRDIARATSAAPTYFETAKIQSVYGTPYYLIDGGMFANNPAMCAYAEARTLNFGTALKHPDKPDQPNAKEMVMVSIGTGSTGKAYDYEKAKNWGAIEWLLPVIDILMSGNSETVDYQLRQLFNTVIPPNEPDYYRLEPKREPADSAMDNASAENMSALHEAGMRFVSDNQDKLDHIVNLLITNK